MSLLFYVCHHADRPVPFFFFFAVLYSQPQSLLSYGAGGERFTVVHHNFVLLQVSLFF